jgi:Gluconate 2-dehydrogenase subunit 3
MTIAMPDRFPGYDVLAKRHTPSWNEATRRVIAQRLALAREPRFFTEDEWLTLNAVCERIVPQPKSRPPIPVAAMVDNKMTCNMTDGYRDARLPIMQEAWRRGLRALDKAASVGHGGRFHAIGAAEQDSLLTRMQRGELAGSEWGDMPCQLFFRERLMHDIVGAYYTHPTSWNEIGFGGPASPRGYVRMGFNKRDPWEAVEADRDAR